MESFKSKCAVGRDKNMSTKKQMQEIIDMQSKEISKISAKVNKIIAKETPSKVNATSASDLTYSETKWQTLAGKAFTGNQISLPPSPKAGSKYINTIIYNSSFFLFNFLKNVFLSCPKGLSTYLSCTLSKS